MVGSGLVDSMARPNGNTTGVSILSTELDGKRQEILIEAVPGLHRMGALVDSNTTPVVKLKVLQAAASARRIELLTHQIAKPEEIPAAIDSAKKSGAAALNVLASPLLFGYHQIIIDRVAALRLPAIYQFPELAELGGLIGYRPRLVQINRDIYARLAIRLLRGLKPGDIPIEQPTKFEIVINLKTAKALGLTMQQSFLLRADEVIE